MRKYLLATVLSGLGGLGRTFGGKRIVSIGCPRNRKTVTAAQQKRAAAKRNNIRKRSKK